MFSVVLLSALASSQAVAYHGKKPVYPPPVLDGGGHPGYHNLGGWGRPYGGYGWTGYHCPDYQHIRPHYTLPLEPLVVPPPGAYCPPKDEDEADDKDKGGDKSSEKNGGKDKDRKEKKDKNGSKGEAGDPGMTVIELTPFLAEKFGFEKDDRGVVVLDVRRKGPAALAGLKPGVIILRANGKALRSPRDLERALTPEALADEVELEVRDAKGKKDTIILGQQD